MTRSNPANSTIDRTMQSLIAAGFERIDAELLHVREDLREVRDGLTKLSSSMFEGVGGRAGDSITSRLQSVEQGIKILQIWRDELAAEKKERQREQTKTKWILVSLAVPQMLMFLVWILPMVARALVQVPK